MINLNEQQFRQDVQDLLELPELSHSRTRVHHFDLTEFDHLMMVAQHAHRLSGYVRADARVAARAGLLHDLGAHWFNTVAPCALAARLEEPHGVCHAIRAHTLLPVLPRTREAWVVVAADFLTSAQECRFVFVRARRRAGSGLRQRLTSPVAWRARLARRKARVVGPGEAREVSAASPSNG
jgi:HD superfamily phosphohydrolase YqeK